jgi:hypothetical protein
MPRFDKTGPMGKGAMTGRGMGKCVENQDSNTEPGFGYGRRGMRKGGGRCARGSGYGTTADQQSNLIASLQERIQKLESKIMDK